jgi:heme-degrading monooxygenase HmoA
VVIEHVILPVTASDRQAFMSAFAQAKPLIEASPGYLGLSLNAAIDEDEGYLLMVRWDSVGAHQDGFRQSDRYQTWRALLHPFYAAMPSVTYFDACAC